MIFFISVSSHLPPFNSSILDTLTVDYTDEYIIEPAYVEYQLSRVNIHKYSGLDGVLNWLLKEFAPLISDPVAAIFNASVRESYVLLIWKSAEVIPAPKVNLPMSIQNDLRPISLLPALAKVLENIIGRWLLLFLEPHFDDNQFGSRGGRSTTHAIIALLHSLMSCLDTGGSVHTVFVNFRKAFDLVNHNLLFDKLQNVYGIPNCLLKCFGSYLSNRHQRVQTNSHQPGSNSTVLCYAPRFLAWSSLIPSSH